MIRKETALNTVVLTTVIVALGIILSGAERHLKPFDQARANHTVSANPEIAEMPNPGLSRVRLLISNLN